MHLRDFMKMKNWAVIGDVDNPLKYAYQIRNELKEKGYKTYGVHPQGTGFTYKRLQDIPGIIDIVDLCINPHDGLSYAREIVEMGIKYVLIQPGAQSEEVLALLRTNKVEVLEGCALVGLRLY